MEKWVDLALERHFIKDLKQMDFREINRSIEEQVQKQGFYSINIDSLSKRPYAVTIHVYREIRKPKGPGGLAMHNHNYFELAYVYSGSCTNIQDGVETVLKCGDALLMNPRVLHQLHPTQEDSVLINLCFSQQLFESLVFQMLSKEQVLSNFFIDYFYQLNQVDDSICFKGSPELSLQMLVRQIVEEYQGDYEFADNILHTQFLLLFGYLAKGYYQRYRQKNTNFQENRTAVSMIRYMNEHLSTVTLENLAARFNYSTSQIARIIHKNFDKSYTEILQNIRLNTARTLLENSMMSVAEIAEHIGVNDSSYFYRIFKKKFGVTPVQYRKDLHNRARL